MFNKIYATLEKDYLHEIPDKLRSEEFDKEVKKYIRSQIKKYGYTLKNHKSPYCESSGFITDNEGHYVYYAVSDYRYWDWTKCVLVRTAKDEKDFRGGSNTTCNLVDIGEQIYKVMQWAKRI